MIEPGPGILLIAEPFLKDPNFQRTVVLLCDHQKEGSFGFVINRHFDHKLNELMNDMDDLSLPVFYGGPVQMDSLHFLHQYPEKIPGSYEVQAGIFWGGDFETAISLLREGSIKPDKIRFFIGYSGWSGGQLDMELKEKSWLTVGATRRVVFHNSASEIWKESLKLLGGEYEQLINYPTDPSLN
ncbi:MAG TPA: YqgE/AlgH family protein [Chitinophagaceae bacterium]|nr:YqgE/AlgH family protein [Chitinophagaceae bacterium]